MSTVTTPAASRNGDDSSADGHTRSEAGSRSHREVLQALSGLLLALLVAVLSSTIVANALPVIVRELHGTPNQYTWVITATLLASTATTPLWGKLADLLDRKRLYQSAIVLFTVGSVLCGCRSR